MPPLAWNTLQYLPEEVLTNKLQQIYLEIEFPIEIRSIFAVWIEQQNWESDSEVATILATLLQKLGNERNLFTEHLKHVCYETVVTRFERRYPNREEQFIRTVRQMFDQERELYSQNEEEVNASFRRNLLKLGLVAGGTTLGTIAAIPAVISGLGFSAAGVVGGSIAASVQSAVYGGATGGLFSLFQSAGVLGASTATQVGCAAGASALTSSIALKLMTKHPLDLMKEAHLNCTDQECVAYILDE